MESIYFNGKFIKIIQFLKIKFLLVQEGTLTTDIIILKYN